jgi:hypothetical protein
MPDLHAQLRDHELVADLRRYFAITTTPELPRQVLEMDARSLSGRRRRLPGKALGAGAAVIALAVVVVGGLTAHVPPFGDATESQKSAAPGSAGFGAARVPTALGATITYPGVNTTMLAANGVARLLPPAGHGTASLSAPAAQSAAVTAAGYGAQAPGPAILAWVEDLSRPDTCLCWVVDVPLAGGVPQAVRRPGPSTGVARTLLVLVDAADGRIVDTLSAPGIP